MDKKASESNITESDAKKKARIPYMQNRELSWLTFDERCLDQGRDSTVPLLERLQFVSIFTSNLQEFFMVRVGSLTDLDLLKKPIIDTKSNMTPREQLDAIYARCHELYPLMDEIYHEVDAKLADEGVKHLQYSDLNDEQRAHVKSVLANHAIPYLSPQIINARHPFPHLENGAIYLIVRLIEEEPRSKDEMTKEERRALKEERKRLKNQGAEGVTLGLVPMPKQASRVIKVPGEGFQYILLEDALEANLKDVFNMYTIKHTNIICVTRNADLDSTETADEGEEDYREHMKKILKKRARLAPVRLESKRKLSATVSDFLLSRLNLEPYQAYTTDVPFDMGFAFGMPGNVDADLREKLTSSPFSPAWPGQLRRGDRIIDQIQKKEVLLSYPYESMDPFVQLLREASTDPSVVSIRITLYRLASSSQLAEALITAAENGKEVTALFELRARFDESNNIAWSQRFEEAGCKVIYGFHDYKVHSKICHITRQTSDGLQHITQLGTGNYNEKTAKLYTDFSFITTNPEIGRDAVEFFRNMGLENASSSYKNLWVAPLQIKQNVIAGIQEQMDLAAEGKPCGLFFKTNSITDKDVIIKIAEASQAGVPVTLLVRGISCLLPQVEGYTDNVRVVSIVGRMLEHSRIYGFGPREEMKIYLASADLMTRNMDKRVEIAWPVTGEEPRERVLEYIATCLADNVKLRELQADGTYTPLRGLQKKGDEPFNAQEYLIRQAIVESERARDEELEEKSAYEKLSMQAREQRRDEARARQSQADIEDVFREALNHRMLPEDESLLAPVVTAAVKAISEIEGVDQAASLAPAIAAAIAAVMPTAEEDAAAKTKTPEKALEESANQSSIEIPINIDALVDDSTSADDASEPESTSETPAEPEPVVEVPAEPAEEPKAEPEKPVDVEEPPAEPQTEAPASESEEEKPAEPAQPEAEAKPEPEAKPAEESESKPDSDTAPKTEAEATHTKPKKKGFFARLFGRK